MYFVSDKADKQVQFWWVHVHLLSAYIQSKVKPPKLITTLGILFCLVLL